MRHYRIASTIASAGVTGTITDNLNYLLGRFPTERVRIEALSIAETMTIVTDFGHVAITRLDNYDGPKPLRNA